MTHVTRWLPVLFIAVALLAFGVACRGDAPTLPPPPSVDEAEGQAASSQDGTVIAEPAMQVPFPVAATLPSVAEVVEAVRPAVVNITTRVETGGFFFRRFGATGNGTGAIIHSDGYVVTNFHVVAGATRIVVTTDDGRHFEATVVGTDPVTDLAVVKIDGDGPFPALPFAPPDSVRVGDWAIAIGNALGLPGGPSVTLGVVGGIDRSLTTQQQSLTDLIQTDAAINEGNSGGPLVDLNGEVIGINTAVVRGAQGMGFSVSSFTVVPVVQSILQHGRVRWPWMGVGISDITAPVALQMDLEDRRGVIIGRVWPNSPAQEAGIQTGDILINIDGHDIASLRELQRVMREDLEVGQEALAVFLREGQPIELLVKLAEMPR